MLHVHVCTLLRVKADSAIVVRLQIAHCVLPTSFSEEDPEDAVLYLLQDGSMAQRGRTCMFV